MNDAARVNDLRLCLALEMNPRSSQLLANTPEFRRAVDALRILAGNQTDNNANDDAVLSKRRVDVDALVSKLGLASNLELAMKPAADSEYFAKMQSFLPGLYIGSAGAASDRTVLQATGITHVCMCLNAGRPPFPSDFAYFVVDVLDVPEAKIGPFFDPSYVFIRQALEGNGRVLIHCAAGISRSASIAIAFLMRHQRLSYEDALGVVRAVRPFVCPNDGFHQELLALEQDMVHTRM